VKLWLDAQLSPEIADWITKHFAVEATAVRDSGLRDASHVEIFTSAKQAGVVVVTKDSDFSQLLQRFGPPPHVIWIRCGNTSNDRLRIVFQRTLKEAMDLIEAGESLVEIADEQ
jgi:predicted nuclease of predicted toxin-antitoxin system